MATYLEKIVLNTFKVKEGHCLHSLGAQSIVRYCEKRGYEIKLISTALNVEQASREILSLNPSVCGLSSNYVTEPYVIKIAKRIKQSTDGKIIIVIGGPSATYSSPKSRIRQCEADLFVRGDGEKAFYKIISNDIPKIISGEKIIEGVSSKWNLNDSLARVNLEDVPSPFPLDFKTDHVYWETTRGCLFSCIYCAHPGKSKDARFVPMGRLENEVDYLSKQNLRAIYITDPILGGTKARSKEILKLLRKIKGPFITAEYRPEFLDEEIIDLIEEVGIGWLELGLQTTNPDLSYFRNNPPNALRNLENLGKRRIPYVLDLIVGVPKDTREGFEESLRFAVEDAKPRRINVFPLRVYEGTDLHKMAEYDDSLKYDESTRIIKESHTFDEAEFGRWMQLGRTTAHLYRFLEENNWFGREREFRNMKFFNRCSDIFGGEFPEIYDAKKIAKIWMEI